MLTVFRSAACARSYIDPGSVLNGIEGYAGWLRLEHLPRHQLKDLVDGMTCGDLSQRILEIASGFTPLSFAVWTMV